MGRYSERAQRIILLAQEEAKRLNHDYVGTEHILLGMIIIQEGRAWKVLNRLKADRRQIREEINKLAGPGDNMMLLGDIPFTPKAKKVLEYAHDEAMDMGSSYVGSEHFLVGLIRGEGIAAHVLEKVGITLDQVRNEIAALEEGREPGRDHQSDRDRDRDPDRRRNIRDSKRNPQEEDEEPDSERESEESQEDDRRGFSRRKPKSRTPNLDEFTKDLTDMARKGSLDPVIGRTSEIERVIQILGRRTKNNPVLVGDPGVGKTAIVEGISRAIVAGDVPEFLIGKRILSLNLGALIAGTKYRGEFEQRMKKLLDEIIDSSNSIILFIDEFHTVIGAGAAEGSLDASNFIKPVLARGELQCIGATTFDEFRKYVEKDPALERRFQKVVVNPPDVYGTIEILEGLKDKYEQHHKCKFTHAAIYAAAELSDKYITDRYLPDKAIDLIDEAGSSARLQFNVLPVEFREKELEIEKITLEKQEAIKYQEFEKAAGLRIKEGLLRHALDEEKKKWRKDMESKEIVVTEEDIARTASKWTGIPVTRMTQSEADRLRNMENEIHQRLIGQHEAVKIVSQAIKRSRTGMKDAKRPIGNFIFLGPTGVGKTELAKVLAEFLFGNEDAMVKVDMSEYMEKFSVSRLIGAPPGYVGYEEGGKLTETVRRKPYSVVVLDEIEKAHPDVFNLLLQIMDEGTLTDSLGHKVSFKNTILIMTSNVGARLISKGKTLGFMPAEEEKERDYKEMKDTVTDEMHRFFSPEFINRIDDVIVFRPLTEEDTLKILELRLKNVENKISDKKMQLEMTDAAKKFLTKRGFDPNFGARPLIRAVQKYVEDPMSEFLLDNTVSPGDTILADYSGEGENLFLSVKKRENSTNQNKGTDDCGKSADDGGEKKID